VAPPNPADLLNEWREAVEGVVGAVSGAAGRSDAAKALLGPLQRQAELFQQLVERQQGLQRELLDRAFEPYDAIFDLLEGSGAMMREQAEALEQAAAAVERAAGLMRRQAELFGTATRTARLPGDVLRQAAGGSPRKHDD
jgi:hypothetical protein